MTRFVSRAAFVVALLTTTACTQQPAEVALKGQNLYGKSGAGYASSSMNGYTPPVYNAPVDYSTIQEAPAGAISISDLSAPESIKKPAPVAQKLLAEVKSEPTKKPMFSLQKPALEPKQEEKQEAKAEKIQTINPWTKKTRDAFRNDIDDKPAAKHEVIPAKPAKQKLSQKTEPVVIQKAKPVHLASKESESFIWPVNGNKVISSYGPKGGGKINDGINIAAATGEPVWAAADGEVIYVDNELEGYGNMVLIKHSGNKTTTYAHLNRATVDKYDRVKQGDIIGYVGESGNVKKPQLHFAIRDGKTFVDPQKYVSRSVAGL